MTPSINPALLQPINPYSHSTIALLWIIEFNISKDLADTVPHPLPLLFLDALASLGSMLESESVINFLDLVNHCNCKMLFQIASSVPQDISHIFDISLAYLGHILAYLGDILDKSWAYFGHILGIS